jgi:hypothetical protein
MRSCYHSTRCLPLQERMQCVRSASNTNSPLIFWHCDELLKGERVLLSRYLNSPFLSPSIRVRAFWRQLRRLPVQLCGWRLSSCFRLTCWSSKDFHPHLPQHPIPQTPRIGIDMTKVSRKQGRCLPLNMLPLRIFWKGKLVCHGRCSRSHASVPTQAYALYPHNLHIASHSDFQRILCKGVLCIRHHHQ